MCKRVVCVVYCFFFVCVFAGISVLLVGVYVVCVGIVIYFFGN